MIASTTTTPQKLVYDVHQLSTALGVSTHTCWRLRASGELPGITIGTRSVRWRVVDVEAYLERLANPTPQTETKPD